MGIKLNDASIGTFLTCAFVGHISIDSHELLLIRRSKKYRRFVES